MKVGIVLDDQAQLERRLWTDLVRLRADFQCEECEKRMEPGTKQATAHHINGDDRDNRLANGACLCQQCHAAHHAEARSKRARETVDFEALRQASRKGWAKLSAEERSDRIKRSWETRRRRAAA